MADYCEFCGDELEQGGQHKSVERCISLCSTCGGLVPDDDRYGDQVDDRCACPELRS